MYPNQRKFSHKPLTKSYVESSISNILKVPRNRIKFERLDHVPDIWKHSCVRVGVDLSRVTRINLNNQEVLYTCCWECGTVHYYFEREVY